MNSETTPRADALKSIVVYGANGVSFVAATYLAWWACTSAPWSNELQDLALTVVWYVLLALQLVACAGIVVALSLLAFLIGHAIYMVLGHLFMVTIRQAITNKPSTWKPWEPSWPS